VTNKLCWECYDLNAEDFKLRQPIKKHQRYVSAECLRCGKTFKRVISKIKEKHVTIVYPKRKGLK